MRFASVIVKRFITLILIAVLTTGSVVTVAAASDMVVAAADGDVVINEINFPDSSFREVISSQFDRDGDGVITADEIVTITYVDATTFKHDITSIQGIEFFTSMTSLRCTNNKITSMDLSKNTALTTLNCGQNRLTNLDLSSNTALTTVICSSNRSLTSINVSGCTELTSLDARYCTLVSLDVTNNTKLQTLLCSQNALQSLDVTKNSELIELDCSNMQLPSLDVTQNTKLQILTAYNNNFEDTNDLNLTYNTELVRMDINHTKLREIDLSHNTKLENLKCDGEYMTELDLSRNTELKNLVCQNNPFTELDLTNNPKLEVLWCFYTDMLNPPGTLKTVKLSENATELKDVLLYNNIITNLDLSKYTNLNNVRVSNNRLACLDLTNSPNILDFTGINQKVDLGKIAPDQYDLRNYDSNIDPTRISNVTGATFTGTVMSGYTEGTPVTYDYACDDNGHTMNVTISFTIAAPFNITYKDGSDDFNNWVAGYTPPVIYQEGTGVTLPTADNIEKEHYTFVGWYDNAALQGTPITEIDTAATGDKTLYAKFEVDQYTVTFKDWDGSVLKTEQVAFNGTATAPTDPTRDGYRFTGWDSSFSNITGNTEVTAQYLKTDSEKSDETNMSDVPQTGDNSSFVWGLTATFISLAATLILLLLRKERQKAKHLRR